MGKKIHKGLSLNMDQISQAVREGYLKGTVIGVNVLVQCSVAPRGRQSIRLF